MTAKEQQGKIAVPPFVRGWVIPQACLDLGAIARNDARKTVSIPLRDKNTSLRGIKPDAILTSETIDTAQRMYRMLASLRAWRAWRGTTVCDMHQTGAGLPPARWEKHVYAHFDNPDAARNIMPDTPYWVVIEYRKKNGAAPIFEVVGSHNGARLRRAIYENICGCVLDMAEDEAPTPAVFLDAKDYDATLAALDALCLEPQKDAYNITTL